MAKAPTAPTSLRNAKYKEGSRDDTLFCDAHWVISQDIRWGIHLPSAARIRGLPFLGSTQDDIPAEAVRLEKGVLNFQTT